MRKCELSSTHELFCFLSEYLLYLCPLTPFSPPALISFTFLSLWCGMCLSPSFWVIHFSLTAASEPQFQLPVESSGWLSGTLPQCWHPPSSPTLRHSAGSNGVALHHHRWYWCLDPHSTSEFWERLRVGALTKLDRASQRCVPHK